MTKNDNNDLSPVAKKYLEAWRNSPSDYETPFSDRELEFIELSLLKLQKFIDSDEPRERHKPLLQDRVDYLKAYISSTRVIKPIPKYKGWYMWDEFRKEKPPKGHIMPLTTRLTFVICGSDRIVDEEAYNQLLDEYELGKLA